jgi:hypothetical protein
MTRKEEQAGRLQVLWYPGKWGIAANRAPFGVDGVCILYEVRRMGV